MRRSPPECAEMVQEILLKLPTRDVARSCCVSKLWRSVVNHPSFRSLHAEANHVSGASEALFISHTRESGGPDEASVFNVSSAKAMCRRVAIPSGYSLANVCNGLLCFAIGSAEAPPVACNPVTGETVALPKAPPLTGIEGNVRHLFALGFSPSTKEHKLFRLSFPNYPFVHRNIHQSVYTLGGGGSGGWRQRSDLSPASLVCSLPPVLVDGKLYVVTTGWLHNPRKPDGILVVDVATEAHRTYRLPYGDDEHHPAWHATLVSTFEMDRRLCVAVYILNCGIPQLQFWVMSPPPENDQYVENGNSKLYWELRYSFYINDRCDFTYSDFTYSTAWFDEGEMMLCYRYWDVLYKLGTRGRSPGADCLPCDRRLHLPRKPSKCGWRICGGYRPSLLSPLAFAPPPSQEEKEQEEFENAMLRALR